MQGVLTTNFQMSENAPETPVKAPRQPTEAELRQQRLAEQLRANLKRRKAQSRARQAEGEEPGKP